MGLVRALRAVRGAVVTELDVLSALLLVAEDVRRMVELAAWSVFLATAFVVGGVLHRWTRGR